MGLHLAPMATTVIILTHARLTATTELTGSRAACSSVLARGMAGDGRGAGVVGAGAVLADAGSSVAVGLPVAVDLAADVGLAADVDSPVDAGLPVDAVRRAASMVVAAGSTVVAEDSTVAAVEVFTVAVADTGNRGLTGSFLVG